MPISLVVVVGWNGGIHEVFLDAGCRGGTVPRAARRHVRATRAPTRARAQSAGFPGARATIRRRHRAGRTRGAARAEGTEAGAAGPCCTPDTARRRNLELARLGDRANPPDADPPGAACRDRTDG